jgi:hypothetical protein
MLLLAGGILSARSDKLSIPMRFRMISLQTLRRRSRVPSRYSYTTNGVANPTLQMQPGEVQRWRLLNAIDGDNLQLVLVSQSNANHSRVEAAWASRFERLQN